MRRWFRPAGLVIFGLVVFAMPGSLALAASPLDGTQWNIKTTAPAAPAPPDSQIQFKDGKFTSPAFEPQGFAPSNYSLTSPEGAPLVWETMQTSATAGILSWRGDLEGDTTMRVVASWRKADGTVVNYSFVGTRIGETPRAATPKPAAPDVVKPKPEATSAIEPKVEEPRATKAKAEEPRPAKPKPKSKAKPKAKAPVQSKPE
jgi:hypothetical protein